MIRTTAKHCAFRDLVRVHCGTFEALPPGAFRESGTEVPGCIVVVGKPR